MAHAPTALREAGLIEALRRDGDVHDYGDVTLPDPSPERDAGTLLIDPRGLATMVASVRDAVASILANEHFPLVIGGDCPLLLGCLAAARRPGPLGLLFVDAHEDAYLPEQSSTGEAADMELAFALGMVEVSWSPALAGILPLVAPDYVRVLGARDAGVLESEGCRRSPIAFRWWTAAGSRPIPPARPRPHGCIAARSLVVPDRKSTRLNSSHPVLSRMPSSA